MKAFILKLLVPWLDGSNVDFKIRTQVPYLAMTSTILFILFALIAPLAFLSAGANAFFFAVLGAIVLIAASLVMLRAGRYRAAAYVATAELFMATVAAVYLMPYAGNNLTEVYRPIAFAAVMAVINFLIALNARQIWLFLAAFAPAWALAFVTVFRGYLAGNTQSAVVVALVGALGIAFETMVLFMIRSLAERMLTTAEAEGRKARESLATVTRLIDEAKVGMNIGGRIIDATEDSGRAVVNVSEIEDYLGKQSKRLVGEMDDLTASSRHVMDATGKMEERLISQNASITETSAALQEILQNILNINEVAKQRRGMLDEAETAGAAQRELVKKLAAAFESVRLSSEGINQFVATVEDIASRTALLSMNASIQAARAGLAGKGFAVVAQEIRALSLETQRNSDTIKQGIEENDATVRETAGLVEEFSAFVVRNIEDTKLLIGSIDEILNGIDEIHTGAGDVMKAIGEIVKDTQASAEVVKDVVLQSEMQQAGFTHLTGFVTALDERIVTLGKAVTDIRASMQVLKDTADQNIEQVKKLQMA